MGASRRVLVVSTDLGGGGMARFVGDFAVAVSELGHEVCVAACGRGGDAASDVIAGRVGIERLSDRSAGVVRRVTQGFGPDWVLLVSGAWPPSTRLALAFGGVPVVETPRTMPRRVRVKLGQRLVYLVRSGKRYRLVAINEEMAAASRVMCGRLGRSVRVVPNCVRLPEERRTARDDGRVEFVSFSRLDESHKDHSTTLRALAMLPEELRGSWRMTFFGEGSDRDRLVGLARELGVEAVFAGKPDDVWREVSRCDVHVLSTRREGLPRAGVEAAAMGLATIGSDVAGVRDLFAGGDGGGGILVPAGDAGALAGVMERMIREPAWRESVASGGMGVAAGHSAEAGARALCDVAEEML